MVIWNLATESHLARKIFSLNKYYVIHEISNNRNSISYFHLIRPSKTRMNLPIKIIILK